MDSNLTDIELLIELSNGLLTPLIAIIAIYIAWQQWKTSERKRRQDLFDKRYAFFCSVWRMFEDPIVNPNKQPLEVTDLLDLTHQAELLFGKDIVDHLFKLPEKQKGGCLDYDWFIKPFKKYLQLH